MLARAWFVLILASVATGCATVQKGVAGPQVGVPNDGQRATATPTGAIHAAVVSRTGSGVVSVCREDGALEAYDRRTGRLLAAGQVKPAERCFRPRLGAFSHDGLSFARLSIQNSMYVLEVYAAADGRFTGHTLLSLAFELAPRPALLGFSEDDGSIIMSLRGRTAAVDVETREVRWLPGLGELSACGRFLAGGGRLTDLHTGNGWRRETEYFAADESWSLRARPMPAFVGSAGVFSFAPDRSEVLFTEHGWSPRAWFLHTSLKPASESPDGSLLVLDDRLASDRVAGRTRVALMSVAEDRVVWEKSFGGNVQVLCSDDPGEMVLLPVGDAADATEARRAVVLDSRTGEVLRAFPIDGGRPLTAR